MLSTLKRLINLLEVERVFQFSLGLNSEFDLVYDCVLCKECFFDLDKAFTLVNNKHIVEHSTLIRKNHHLLEVIQVIMFTIGVPKYFEGETI